MQLAIIIPVRVLLHIAESLIFKIALLFYDAVSGDHIDSRREIR